MRIMKVLETVKKFVKMKRKNVRRMISREINRGKHSFAKVGKLLSRLALRMMYRKIGLKH